MPVSPPPPVAVSLGRLLEEIGTSILENVAGRVDPARPVTSLVIHDADDRPSDYAGALVLGVGLRDPADIAELVSVLADAEAAGLVLAAPVPFDAAVARAVDDGRIAVFERAPGVPWSQVAGTVLGILMPSPTALGEPTALSSSHSAAGTDLFGVANAISALLDAPITIEDLNSQILAFSADQARADDARKRSVLGQHVPGLYLEWLRERGVFRRIYSSPEPVYLEPAGEVELGRLAVRVTAGQEVLGSIWAVVTEPPNEERRQSFVEAARLVGLHLLRLRFESDSQRLARRGLLSALLAGGDGAIAAAHRAGLPATSLAVLALALDRNSPGDDPGETETAATLTRVANAFDLHLTAVSPRSIAAVVGDTVYGVLPVDAARESPEGYLREISEDFLARSVRPPLLLALGGIVASPSELRASRDDADRTLRVLASSRLRRGRSVLTADEARVDALLLDLVDRLGVDDRALSGPVADLAEFDAGHDTDLVETLDTFLTRFGDVAATAAALHVHPNTCRYRLRRITEISGLDLADPDARFSAQLQLRMLKLR